MARAADITAVARGWRDDRSHARPPSVFLLVGTIALCAPTSTAAQDLEGWRAVYSSAAYDYLVSLESSDAGAPRTNPVGVVELFVAQMLVRDVEATRRQVLARIQGREGASADYAGYVSTTHFVELRCDERTLAVRRSSDFDRRGDILREWPADVASERGPVTLEPAAVDAVVAWACARRGGAPWVPADLEVLAIGATSVAGVTVDHLAGARP